MARPTDYTLEMAATICGRLANGEALSAMCREEDMPGLSTVYQWRAKHPEFAEMYARAREDQADTLADELVAVADDETIPADSRRIRVDARKWAASKLKPRAYGDRLDMNHSGGVSVTLTSGDAAL